MRIVAGKWFWMPQVSGDIFKMLVNEAVLKYDRTKGFRATGDTDLALVRSILKKTLNEDVEVLLSCFICGDIVDCNRCRYGDTCGGVTSFQSCVCKNCEKSEEAQSIYSIRFAQLLT